MDVKSIAKSRGYSMTDVAEKMGITRVTLAQTLSRNPTINTLKRIADVLGCHVSDFFEDERGAEATAITCPHCGKKIYINTSTHEN